MIFQTYRVVSLDEEITKANNRCNERCFPFSYPQNATNLLTSYVTLLEYLKGCKHLEIDTIRNMPNPLPNGKSRLMIRHDVDHDLVTAVVMSYLEKIHGIPASYYLHHISPYYYGDFDSEGVFHRYEAMARNYLTIQENGAEVGLHVDALSVYEKGIDGMQAVVTEIEWLRSIGLTIRGTAAHGSAPYYGAENFEIFKDHCSQERILTRSDGKEVKLGLLSEKELNLDYEANFPTFSYSKNDKVLSAYFSELLQNDLEKHLYRYLHCNPYTIWGQDYTVWLYGRNRWVIAATDNGNIFHYDASIDDVFNFLVGLRPGYRVVIHIHPVYYGLRLLPTLYPIGSCLRAISEDKKNESIVYNAVDDIQMLADLTNELERKFVMTDRKISNLEKRMRTFEQVYEKMTNHWIFQLRNLLIRWRK